MLTQLEQHAAIKLTDLNCYPRHPLASPLCLELVETSPTHKKLVEFGEGILRTATSGVSLEPISGSATGSPSGPVSHDNHTNPVEINSPAATGL